jgi:hypothetical protein
VSTASHAAALTPEDEAALRRRARVRCFLFPGAGFGILGYPGWSTFGFSVLWAVTVSITLLAFFPNPLSWAGFVGCTVLSQGFWATEYFAVRKLPILEQRSHNLASRHFGVVTVVTYVALLIAGACAGYHIQVS